VPAFFFSGKEREEEVITVFLPERSDGTKRASALLEMGVRGKTWQPVESW